MDLMIEEVESPIGVIMVALGSNKLYAVEFSDCSERLRASLAARFGAAPLRSSPRQGDLSMRIKAYFDGDLQALAPIPVDAGGTQFQQRVWTEVRRIAPGATRSYGEVAALLGCPLAARAVGLANAKNPVCLVIPCHRVIGSGGALTGYAGGIERK